MFWTVNSTQSSNLAGGLFTGLKDLFVVFFENFENLCSKYFTFSCDHPK